MNGIGLHTMVRAEHGQGPAPAEDMLQRDLTPRHVAMIAIAGTIGSGLFLSTGQALAAAGPVPVLATYALCGFVVYLTILALGEMATYTPVAGLFSTFALRYVDRLFGFALTWNYWLNDAVSVALDLTALQLVAEYWTASWGWAVSLVFWGVLVVLNTTSVRVYGEVEYWMGAVKVVAIVAFLVVGVAVNLGFNTNHAAIGFSHWRDPGMATDGFRGLATVFVLALFLMGGIELVAITNGETRDPVRTIPKVTRMVFWRVLLFYLLLVFVIGINIPYTYPGLLLHTAQTLPFTLVFQLAGGKAAAGVINAVVFSLLVSAGNHALYAGTRLLHSLGLQGFAPQSVGTVSRRSGVPLVALAVTASVLALCLVLSLTGAGVVWRFLQHLVGVLNQLVWLSVGLTLIRFRRGLAVQGKTHRLAFRNWTHPWGSYVVVGACGFMVVVQGWSAWAGWHWGDLVSYYLEVVVVVVMYFGWKRFKGTAVVAYESMDLETDRWEDGRGSGVEA